MEAGPGRNRAPGVRLLIVVVALVPLSGLAFLATRAVSDSSSQADSAQEITRITHEVNHAIQLQSQITIESFTANALSSAASLGVPLEVVSRLTGLDLVAATDEATAAVDELLLTAELAEVERLLTSARGLVAPTGAGTTTEIERAYQLAEDEVAAFIDERLVDLEQRAVNVGDDGRLLRSLEFLELATELRSDFSALTAHYFGVRFIDGGIEDDLFRLLLGSRADYISTTSTLDDLVPVSGPVASSWDELKAASSVATITSGAEQIVEDRVFDTGVEEVADDTGVAISTETQIFLDSLDALSAHVGFVDGAAQIVSGVASSVQEDAAASRNRTLFITVLLAVASVVAGAVATRWIVRPLRVMEGAVRRLEEGDFAEPVRVGGPKEVRRAAGALNDAVRHLALAEAQALALAGTNPDHPALSQPAPGRLGQSLQKAVASLAASMADREEFRQRLAHEATHDGLTGLANRSSTLTHLEQALARARRSESTIAVLFVDIDDFKSVNDEHGHGVGDRLLQTVAERLTSAVRTGDHVGRLGGDEFVVIAEPVASVEEATRLASRMLATMEQPVRIGEFDLARTASIGVAVSGSDDLTADEVLRDSDLAVYKAKTAGRARVEICNEQLREELQQRVDIERALRQALENDELKLHYQPIVDVKTSRVTSFEALLRWPTAPESVTGPDDFIPVAERSDLIIDIDRWVIATVAEQLREWEQSLGMADVKVAINLSAKHLSVASLVSDVVAPLSARGISPGRVSVEITETALLNDFHRAAVVLEELRSHGVEIAIDDFGTGYASLSHLRRLPIDVLKIDRSFVANLDQQDDRSLVSLIIDTGHLLGLSVTAEGVEDDDTERCLVDLGADKLQGFLYGRPGTPGQALDSIEIFSTPLRR